MGQVDDIAAGDAGEEIFVAARKPHDLVREGGAAYNDVVVFGDQLVDAHGHVFFQGAPGQFLDLGRGDGADGGQGVVLVPGVVDDADIFVGRGPLFGVSPRCLLMAASDMAVWVPRAMRKSVWAARGCRCLQSARNISGIGPERVASGMITRTRLPSMGARPLASSMAWATPDRISPSLKSDFRFDIPLGTAVDSYHGLPRGAGSSTFGAGRGARADTDAGGGYEQRRVAETCSALDASSGWD